MKLKVIILLTLCCFVRQSAAIEFSGMQQDLSAQSLRITPQFDIQVTQKVIDAINNGIVITFVYQAKSYKKVAWWFDALVQSKINTYEVRYFSLLNQYQLHLLKSKDKLSFKGLEELLTHLGHRTSFEFDLDQSIDYFETRFFLDKQALPSIMQLPNVFDADWNINSDWQQVPLENFPEEAPNP